MCAMCATQLWPLFQFRSSVVRLFFFRRIRRDTALSLNMSKHVPRLGQSGVKAQHSYGHTRVKGEATLLWNC